MIYIPWTKTDTFWNNMDNKKEIDDCWIGNMTQDMQAKKINKFAKESI